MECFRVAGHEYRWEQPSERRGGGDGADDDIGSAERFGEGGQDRGLRGKGQPDHIESEVAAQRQDVAAQVLLDEVLVVAVEAGKGHRSSLWERIGGPSRLLGG